MRVKTRIYEYTNIRNGFGGFEGRIGKFIFGFFAFCLAGFGSVLEGSDQIPGAVQKQPIALVGGTVHPVSGAAIDGGVLLFDQGRITAIGKEIALPDGIEQIDVAGKHIYPGLVAAYTSIGLAEISAVRSTRDYSEIGSFTPSVRAEVAFNPDSEVIPVTRANGVLVALSTPTGGIISGQAAVMMLDGWTWEDMTLKAPAGLRVAWPNMNVQRVPQVTKAEETKQQKRAEDQVQRIRDMFAEARAYLRAKEAEKQKDIPHHDVDMRWEAMAPILNKEMPVFVYANDIRRIQAAVDWAQEEDVRMVLVGGKDAWRVADLLKEKDIPVIVEHVHTLPARRWEGYDAPFVNPLRLLNAGVKFCIAGSGNVPFTSAHARNLPYQAGTAAAYGLPKDEALKAVTLYPAQILGVGDRVGSLEVGKDATLIVTDGDPLEIRTHVEKAFVQGRMVDLSSRHTQLYEKYKAKYQQLGLTKDAK